MTTAPIRWSTPKPSKPWALPAASVVTVVGALREDWLAARKTMICGSDIAKLYGVSPYGDAFTVWADKTNRLPERDATNAMVRGSILEDGVVDLWVSRYVDFPIETKRQGLVRSRRHPHAGATVDRLSICELGRCLVEVKTQADVSDWGTEAEPEVPTPIQFQGQWQLGVTGRGHIHYVVLGPRLVPIHRIQYRDEDLIETMLRGVDEWWPRYVDADVPPSPTHRAADTVRTMYGNPTAGKRYVLDDEAAGLFRALPILKADAVAAQQAYDDVLVQLQALVGDATEIYWSPDDEKPAATWRPGKTIDGATKAFVAQNREVVEPFVRLVDKEELDVEKLVENHPEFLADGRLRYRRKWDIK